MSDIVDLSKPPAENRDQPSPEEIVALLNGAEKTPGYENAPVESDLDVAVGGGLKESVIPIIINLKDGNQFISKEIGAWGWTPFGIFAVGNYFDEDDEKSILFHGDTVHSIELQRDIYEAALAEQEKQEDDDGTED